MKNVEIDKLIHEPARLKVMLHLYCVDAADFIYLMHKTGLSRGNLSSHMSKLEECGYVDVEKTFIDKLPKTLYRISNKGRASFEEYKSTILSLLNSV